MSKPFPWNFFNDESDRIEFSICNKMRKVSSGLFSNSCTKLLTLGTIHKACLHIRRGRAVRQKWINTDRGREVVSQMWTSAWKKNYSYHICEIFGQLCLCVTFTSWSTPSFGMLLSKLSNRNTCVYIQYQNDQFFYPSV